MHVVPRLPIRALVAAFVAVAGLAAAPGRAAASCGDYVRVEGDQRAAQHASPVSGPNRGRECSKAPTNPAVPVTAPPRLAGDTDQPVAAADADGRPPRDAGWPRTPGESGRPISLHVPVFHPPRAA